MAKILRPALAGSDVAFAWDLGDGTLEAGQQVLHFYAAEGAYTATNSLGSLSASTVVSMTTETSWTIYLPVLLRGE